jgi:hypothetical protein
MGKGIRSPSRKRFVKKSFVSPTWKAVGKLAT